MATPKTKTTAARTRSLKKRIEVIVTEARNRAFNEVVALAAKEHPTGWGVYTWFGEAWQNAPLGRREVRS